MEKDTTHSLGFSTILIHLGLIICGIAALLSGLLAEDYKKIEHLGFTVHSWVGMAAAGIILVRFVMGVVGPSELRFSNWVPYTRERLIYVKEDLKGLFKFRMPERPAHVGMAGLVETYGLLVFLLAALSGVFLFFAIEPGHKSQGMAHTVKEFHEVGMYLILLFLSMHVGAVIMHALQGRHLWPKMFFLKKLHLDTDSRDTSVDQADCDSNKIVS